MGVLKKYLGLFGFCLIFSQAVAQVPFNVAYHDKQETIGSASSDLIEIYGDYYFSSVRTDGESFYSLNLYKISGNGILKFKKIIQLPFSPNKLIKTLDNNLLLIGGENVCDVPPPNPRNFICKLDTGGAFTFTNSIIDNLWDGSKNVLQYVDSTYYVFTDSILYRYDTNGIFIQRKNTGLKEISSTLLHPNGDILLSAKNNSIITINRMNSSGLITGSMTAVNLFNKMELYNNTQIMAIGMDGKIYKLSSNYTQIGVSNFPPSVGVKDMVINDDTLYCMSTATLQSYLISDTSFIVMHLANTSSQGFTQKAIIKKQNKIGILSDALSKTSPNFPSNQTYVTLNVFDRTASNNFDNDIEVISIVADSSYALVSPSTNSFAPNIYTVFLRAKVKVKNKGNSVLNNFKLNHYKFTNTSGCGSFFYQQKFDAISLGIGDSVEVITPFLQNTTYSFGIVQPTIALSYCIFGTVPNGMADKHYQDNELCKIFNFQVNDVSIRENYLQANSLIISPNPFNSVIHIQSDEKIRSINIQNCLGQKLRSVLVNANESSINLSEMLNGIYFLKVETEKGIQLKKVIKN